MKKTLLETLLFAGTFLGLVLLFDGLLFLACCIDSAAVKDNVVASYHTLEKQGYAPVVFSPLAVCNDNYTEAILINLLYSVDSTQPFVSALRDRKNFKRGLTCYENPEVVGEWLCVAVEEDSGDEALIAWWGPKCIKELGDFLDDKVHVSVDYARYWHGHLSLYRPLFLFCNIEQVRHLLLATYAVLYIVFLWEIKRRFGPVITTIFGSALLFSGYFTVALSLQCALNFVVTMIGAIIFVRRIDTIRRVYLFIFTVACWVNFVDFLTNPLVCLGILASLYLLKMREDKRDWRDGLRFTAGAAGAWLLGYGGMWFGKWVQYDIFINDGNSLVVAGLQQCLYRMGGTLPYINDYPTDHLFITQSILGRATLFALITAIIVLWQRRFAINMHGFNKNALPYLLVSLFPLVWYFGLHNHTLIHFFFTYRTTSVYIIGLLLAMNEQFLEPIDTPATSVADSPRQEPRN